MPKVKYQYHIVYIFHNCNTQEEEKVEEYHDNLQDTAHSLLKCEWYDGYYMLKEYKVTREFSKVIKVIAHYKRINGNKFEEVIPDAT